jgi:hypothetical protein
VDGATAKNRLFEAINRSQRLVNYAGPGSVNLWRGNLLTASEAQSLANQSLPMFVMMTCLKGYFHDPVLDSLGESLLKAESGGAIAVWASTALTEPGDHAILNQAFYRLIFDGNGKGLTIGEAVMKAKASIANPDIRRTWILLGDPTTRFQ